MPRQRQRIVYCDCFDCLDRPQETSLTPEQLDAATAVARQEPPPKALLLYATNIVAASNGTTNLDSCTLPHCNLIVREGNLGLLAVRKKLEGTSATIENGARIPPAVAELAQVLGVYQDVCRPAAPSAASEGSAAAAAAAAAAATEPLPSLAARFKGMQAAFASSSPSAAQLASRLGMALVERLCLGQPSVGPDGPMGHSTSAPQVAAPQAAAPGDPRVGSSPASSSGPLLGGVLPEAGLFARALAEELGASEGGSGRDLLLLHLDLQDLRRAAAAAAGTGTAVAVAGPEAAGQGQQQQQEPGVCEAGSGGDAEGDAEWDASCEALEWLDALLRGLLALPEIRERTLLVLMLSPTGQPMPAAAVQGPIAVQNRTAVAAGLLQPGGAGVQIDPSAAVVTPRNPAQLAAVARDGSGAAAAAVAAAMAGAAPSSLSVLDAEDYPLVSRPVQSFEFLGMERVDVDLHAPVLVARRLPGVMRRDRAERMTYREALTAGGQSTILIDRMLPEVAYKIGRAPKYGA